MSQSEAIIKKSTSKHKQLALEGNCPRCGKFSYPYYLCDRHRIEQNTNRVLRQFELKGWVDIKLQYCNKKRSNVKTYKWNKNTPTDIKTKMSPEGIAKMRLPRMNGKPMDDSVLRACIMEVLNKRGYPCTVEEIENGIKQMKTIGSIIPTKQDFIREYLLIRKGESSLSKSQRDAVEFRINFMIMRKLVNENEVIIL